METEEEVMNKVKIRWTCPCCGRKNRWKWPKEEIVPGWIKLTCDHCEEETNTLLWWKDRADAIAWVEEAR